MIEKLSKYFFVLGIQLYYKMKTPFIERLVGRLLPYETRHTFLGRYYKLQARRTLHKWARLSVDRSFNFREILESEIIDNVLISNGGQRIRFATYKLAVELDPSEGHFLRYDGTRPSLELSRVPFWGSPSDPIVKRTCHFLPDVVCHLATAEIEGDCLGVFSGRNFYSLLMPQATPAVYAAYLKHNVRTLHRDCAFELAPKDHLIERNHLIFFSPNNSYADNYFHFHADVLPSLIMSILSLSEEDRRKYAVLVPLSLPPNIRVMLDLFLSHFGLEAVEFGERSFVISQDLVFSAYCGNMPDIVPLNRVSMFHVVPAHVRRLRQMVFDELKTAPLRNQNADRVPIVYVTRRDLRKRGRRYVTNSDEIIEAITARGGEVIFPEKMSLAEQMQAMHRANCVVCDAGAAVANALHCRPGTSFLVLINNLGAPQVFMSYFEGLPVRPGFVFGDQSAAGSPGNVHANCAVPLERLDRALAYFGGAEDAEPDGWL